MTVHGITCYTVGCWDFMGFAGTFGTRDEKVPRCSKVFWWVEKLSPRKESNSGHKIVQDYQPSTIFTHASNFFPNWHQLHPAKSYIISHDGSMVQVYMLTWLGYMNGIHGTPYIAAPLGSVMGIFPSSHPRRGCEPALGAYQFARDFFCTVAEVTGGQAVALSSAAMLADVTGWWEKMLRKMRVSHILYESHIITDIHWL